MGSAASGWTGCGDGDGDGDGDGVRPNQGKTRRSIIYNMILCCRDRSRRKTCEPLLQKELSLVTDAGEGVKKAAEEVQRPTA